MILNEDLFDIPAEVVISDDISLTSQNIEPQAPDSVEDNGLSNLIITEINGEWDTIKNYNQLLISLKQFGHEEFNDVIQDIIREENKHIGQLQTILERISPNVSEIDSGEMEAEEQLPDTTEV